MELLCIPIDDNIAAGGTDTGTGVGDGVLYSYRLRTHPDIRTYC